MQYAQTHLVWVIWLEQVEQCRLVFHTTEQSANREEEVAGGWRRLSNEELHYMYASPNVVMMTKSR